ncbi:MAG: putative GntR family transcriptional regulator [Ilumatobacteraceae bacterium]|nr:putative GntR family transcriptional regulator [Ilumatobacteraceae bacterium]
MVNVRPGVASPLVSNGNSVESNLLPIWREVVELGQALPSEEALAETLGTSRPAIREALIRMEADGLVRRLHGAGTFPNPAALEIPVRMDRAADFSDRLASVGFEVTTEVISAEVIAAGESEAATLGLEAGTRLLRTVKRWRADGVVAVVAFDHVPLSRRASGEASIDAAADAVLHLATEYGAGRADWMCTYPTAVEVDGPTAELLEYEPGRAVLRLEQIATERHGRRVFHALEYHRPGLVEFGLIRTIH